MSHERAFKFKEIAERRDVRQPLLPRVGKKGVATMRTELLRFNGAVERDPRIKKHGERELRIHLVAATRAEQRYQ